MKLSELVSLWKDLVYVNSLIDSNPELILLLILIYIFKFFLTVLKRIFKRVKYFMEYKNIKKKILEKRIKTLNKNYWIEI